MTARKWTTMQERLDEMERTNPAVRRAREKYDRMVRDVLADTRAQSPECAPFPAPQREPIEAVLKRNAELLDKLNAQPEPTDDEVLGGLVDDVRERLMESKMGKGQRTERNGGRTR